MVKPKSNLIDRLQITIIKLTAADSFYIAVLVLFAISCIWVAFSGVYPGAFDEDNHLTIINYFSHHPNPFFGQQPITLDQYGPILHDPSYLFRYLMSGPWWLILHLSNNFTIQIILMRLINIALFVLSIILFRKFLLKVTSNRSLINLAILLLALTPMSIQLASQINYDNLLMPIFAAVLILAADFIQSVKTKQASFANLGWLISLGLIGCLVKYIFITILLGIFVYIIIGLKLYKPERTSLLASQLKINFHRTSMLKRIILIVLIGISFCLFFERFGLNTWRYHTPAPSCVKVIGEQRCQAYSIYQRGVTYKNTKPAEVNNNPIRFTYLWLKHMLFNVMMTINGPASGYSIGLPLPFPYAMAIIFIITGFILTIIYWRQIFASDAMRIFGVVLIIYLSLLWLLNYASFLSTGRRVAVQGRYLMPFLLLIYSVFLMAFTQLLINHRQLKITLATVLIVFFLLGGGVLSFILHSDTSWYWPNNQTVNTANQKAKSLFFQVIPGSKQHDPYWQSSFDF